MELLHIKTFGEFSLSYADNKISDSGSRSKKVWQLLAYLISHKDRTVSAKELILVLWGEDCSGNNPENTLKITFHRARKLLDQLWPSAGHQLIRYRENGYSWNQEIPYLLDADTFEQLCRAEHSGETERLEAYLSALELYKGNHLDKHSSEHWAIPITTHYHTLYIETIINTVPLLDKEKQHSHAVILLRKAITAEPYHEALYQLLIQQLAAQGNTKAAREAYEELNRRLIRDFGIHPCNQTQAVYHAAVHTMENNSVTMENLMEDMQEKNSAPGALYCSYETFKTLCHFEARSIQRSEKDTHIALISVSPTSNKALSKRSKHIAMTQMGEEIRLNLRRGDAFSQCSLSQYIIMLPNANYENSCMVCRRLIASFNRNHPYSPVQLHFMVQPLSTQINVP